MNKLHLQNRENTRFITGAKTLAANVHNVVFRAVNLPHFSVCGETAETKSGGDLERGEAISRNPCCGKCLQMRSESECRHLDLWQTIKLKGLGTLEIVIIIAALLTVALIFRTTLMSFARNLFDKVFKNSIIGGL